MSMRRVLLFLFLAIATSMCHAQWGLVSHVCEPIDCQDNWGPARTGSAQTSISGICKPLFDPIGPITLSITILIPCNHDVVIETGAEGFDIDSLNDCGSVSTIGQIQAHGTVLGGTSAIYTATKVEDCIGGESPPVPPFQEGC
jgi:hypothetical protein